MPPLSGSTRSSGGEPGTALNAPEVFWQNSLGKMYLGDSLGLLHRTLKPRSIDLIVTSPPFGLVRKKAYGNVPSSEYLDWFRPFASGLKRVLKDTGSLVIDIGPAWNPGVPTKSTYQFTLLCMLCEEFGFHLAQDFYWWNPSRMPAPAEWVNIRRLRVKDSVNPVWWLSPTPWPKASNRRVLTSYGERQKRLFSSGYNSGQRPSGHIVSEEWGRDNGGAIAPNLIAAPNTSSNDPYHAYCRSNGLEPHPARFPSAIPEFFIRMLTDIGDTVLDPFGGSCVTGSVADSLRRKWICCDLSENYLRGAIGRFPTDRVNGPNRMAQTEYKVPATSWSDPSNEEALAVCGGQTLGSRKPYSQSDR
ncbi:MAG: site-specific DNA-methyltransferase [Xanthomonadales bacterium]|nr:site-specific DNA-methyltransferase [Xanthomonadales bacterium]